MLTRLLAHSPPTHPIIGAPYSLWPSASLQNNKGELLGIRWTHDGLPCCSLWMRRNAGACTHTHTFTHTNTPTCAHTHTHTHTQTHVYTHTQTHTHKDTRSGSVLSRNSYKPFSQAKMEMMTRLQQATTVRIRVSVCFTAGNIKEHSHANCMQDVKRCTIYTPFPAFPSFLSLPLSLTHLCNPLDGRALQSLLKVTPAGGAVHRAGAVMRALQHEMR